MSIWLFYLILIFTTCGVVVMRRYCIDQEVKAETKFDKQWWKFFELATFFSWLIIIYGCYQYLIVDIA